LSFRFSER